MGPECFNLACIVGISYAEPLNTEAFDLFKIPLTLSERAGKIIGNVANCNSHDGKPGNPIISNNEWSGNNTSANLSCYNEEEIYFDESMKNMNCNEEEGGNFVSKSTLFYTK